MRADAHQQRALQLEHAMSMLVETHAGLAGVSIPAIPWLDTVTADAVADVTQSLIQRHPEVQAVILFGSVARHEERPLDDPHPSDVDLGAGATCGGRVLDQVVEKRCVQD